MILADDHAVLRAGLRALIDAQPDMEVIAEAADGEQAVRQAQGGAVDVAVLDLSMPGMSGIETIHRMREQAAATKILVLTMHDDPAYPRSALAAGALGYLTKDVEGPELLSAIRAVHRGRTYVQFGPAGGFDDAEQRPPVVLPQEPAHASLSARERQVLQLLARGYTNRETAALLSLSVKTIETYRARLGEKLGLRTRAEMVRLAMDLGLLSDPSRPG